MKPKKPIELPKAENVGESVGETTTKFTKGLFKGAWKGIFPAKENNDTENN